MKFSEMRREMDQFSGAQTNEYQLKYLALEVKDAIEGINRHYVDYLTFDIIESREPVDFKSWLGKSYYSTSNSYAKSCIEECLTVKHIYGYRIKTWTDHALKCYDNFLLKHIQEERNEKIQSSAIHPKEQDVYQHLIQKGGDLQEIGQAFSSIYQERNSFYHIQFLDIDGIRHTRNLNNTIYNNKRDIIISCFKNALKRLVEIAKN